MPSLADRYHPREWSQLAGQDATLRKLDCVRRSRGTLAGGNYWISGLSGTGKSTLADLIAAEVAHDTCVREFGGRRLGVDDVAAVSREMRTRGFAPGGRVCVVNEAHTLRRAVIEELLVACDQRTLPGHACWIFTTTCRGEKKLFEDFDDSRPLLSRCTKLELATDVAEPLAIRARMIAQENGMDGQPHDVYVRLLLDCECNMREALNRIEAGELLESVAPVAVPRRDRLNVWNR